MALGMARSLCSWQRRLGLARWTRIFQEASSAPNRQLLVRVPGPGIPGEIKGILTGRRFYTAWDHDNEGKEKVVGSSSEGEESLSESESLWSQGEDVLGSGSEFEDEGDGFLNDHDLWESEGEEKGEEPKAEAVEDDEKNESDAMVEELARVVSDIDPDAMKKAEERFRQDQGEAARVRKEADAYLKAMKKEYDARSLVQDEHCQKVHTKLANLKPGPDGRYRNLMEVVSDIDILLEAYRRVKAGPAGDPSKVPIHNINMDWFHETQAKLRDGSFRLKPIKVVEVEKREIARLERSANKFHRYHRRPRQPF